MKSSVDAGWLAGAQRLDSPNFDDRPSDVAINAVIVHGISLPPGTFGRGWIDALFMNRLDGAAHPYFRQIADRRVSAHLLVTRAGAVSQFVALDKRAWHAGRSCLAGRERVNDFSIGIELEGTDDCPYAVAQYRRLAVLCAVLMAQYPGVSRERIVGHADIAPGRKTDPGPVFDWRVFHRLLAQQRSAI